MRKSNKIWLGIATFWPVVYVFLFIVLVVVFTVTGPGSKASADFVGWLGPGMVVLFLVHMLTILGTLALTVFYIVRVMNAEQLDQNLKIVWIILLFFFGMLAQPVFWYLYIWREAPRGKKLGMSDSLPPVLRNSHA
jgi:hypothetical protein